MIIMIDNDGSLWMVDAVTPDELLSADDGIVDFIDVSVADAPTQYGSGEWHPIKRLDSDG